MERFRSNLKNLDPYLGAYPFENYRTWFSLSNHISKKLLGNLKPEKCDRISAQAELVTLENATLGEVIVGLRNCQYYG